MFITKECVMRKLGLVVIMGLSLAACNKSSAESNYSEQGVIQYLTQNPNVMDSVLSNQNVRMAYQDWSQRQQDKRLSQYFDSASASKVTGDVPVSAVPISGVSGSPIKIVEFFDYRCGYCSKALSNIEALKKQSKDEFTLVYRPVGMLGGQSRFLARLSIAVWQNKAELKQGYTYDEFNQGLFTKARLSRTEIENWLSQITRPGGVDKIKNAVSSSSVEKVFIQNKKLAQQLGVNGVPAFIVGDTDTKRARNISGAVSADTLQQAITAVSKG